MAAYTKPRQCKKEERKKLRGVGDRIKLIELRLEGWQLVGLRKARRRQDVL